MRPEGLCQRQISVTQSGIEPAAFSLVAQFLNKLRHRMSVIHAAVSSKNSRNICLTAEYDMKVRVLFIPA